MSRKCGIAGGVLVLIGGGLLLLGACTSTDAPERNNPVRFGLPQIPPAPQDIWSVTGDETVILNWIGPLDSTIVEYHIWRSLMENGTFWQVGTVNSAANPGLDLLQYDYSDTGLGNGVTYYYTLSSVNHEDAESELSARTVFDTPRPEGTTELIAYQTAPFWSGFDFPSESVVDYTDENKDIFVDKSGDSYYLNRGTVDHDIQDMGYHVKFSDVDWAPDSGWSEEGSLEIVDGHVYVIWTREDHYAKVRVEGINASNDRIFIKWAYQPSTGERGRREL